MELQQPMSKRKQGNRIRALCASSPFWAALLCVFLIGACSTVPTPAARRQHADELAAAAGWSPLLIPAGKFTLAAYLSPAQTPGAALAIYIEGDGAAWLNRSTPSADPTPVRATGLELALRHPGGTAAYLARPCQFVASADRHGCQLAYWTEARFGSAVIESTNLAIDALKTRTGAQRVILVGYSGGGAVAALAASRRNDVDRLLTVAGNLDHVIWTKMHGVEPLSGSLNPADSWPQLVDIPQRHWVGDQDKVIDRKVALSFRARFPVGQQPEVVIVPGFDHQCCWAREWPQLLGR